MQSIDPDGRPRTSPVYFSHDGYRDLYWVSAPDAQHSRNIVRDPRVAGVIFDSSVPPGSGASAAYVTGMARQVPDFELEKRCAVAFHRLVGTARAFKPEELRGEAPLRLYVMDVELWEAHLPGVDPDDEAADIDKNGRISIWEAFAAAAAGVRAKDVRRQWFVGGSLAYHTTQDAVANNASREGDPRPDDYAGRELALDDTIQFGLHGGYGFTPSFSLQLDAGWFQGDAGSVDVWLSKRYPASRDPLNPYNLNITVTSETSHPLTAGTLTQRVRTYCNMSWVMGQAMIDDWVCTTTPLGNALISRRYCSSLSRNAFSASFCSVISFQMVTTRQTSPVPRKTGNMVASRMMSSVRSTPNSGLVFDKGIASSERKTGSPA